MTVFINADTLHKELEGDDIHKSVARVYVDIAARDADNNFQVPPNVDKIVRVDTSPVSYYILVDSSPVTWTEISPESSNDFIELLDSPSTYSGNAGNVLQVNPTSSGIEFGQPLRLGDEPEFAGLTLTGDLIVEGDVAQLAVGSLFVGDSNIEIGDVDIPTDDTAEGGGLTLHGDTDKTIKWRSSKSKWEFNQGIDLEGNDLVTSGRVIVGKIAVDNLEFNGNSISTIIGDLDVDTFSGGVFQFNNNAFRSGLDSINYTELGHDGSNSIINAVGTGNLDIQVDGIVQVTVSSVKLKVLNDLEVTGNLIVQGTTTTLDTTTLLVEDKNIEIGNVAVPTDVTADGGGITLKGTNDITITWLNATNAWTFNQSIDLLGNNLISTGIITATQHIGDTVIASNLKLDGNTLSSLSGDLDVTTGSGGVFKFVDNALRSGLDASNYLEVGHGGSNSFINQVGTGGMDFRFEGVTKANFTSAGHLHLLTDVDQKHTLKIKTANNLNDTGLAWENSGGSFTHTIFRTDVGSNRADLVFAAGLNSNIDLLTNSFKIHGEAADAGKLEVLGALQISSGIPGAGKILQSDANGIATWETTDLTAAGGWTDDGTVVRLTTSTDKVGIGSADPQAELEVGGNPGTSVGGFPSGNLHVTGQSTLEFRNAVITGHNLFNGNTQLWYLGSTSSSNNNIALINRQNAELHLHTNDLNRFTIQAGGNVGIGETNPSEKLEVNGNIKVGQVIDKTIFAQLNSSVDQEPSDTNPTVITYNTQDSINGLTHSTTVNPGEITVNTEGIYFVSPQPQVGKDSGGVKVDFDMFLQVDRGSGFVDEDNSNIKLAIKDADITDVIVSNFTISLNVGDKIRMMQKVSSSSVGMGLKNTDPVVGPPSTPRTPSIIFTMYRVGGKP